MLNIVFMGTPDFSVFSLKALVESGQHIIGVVTQPDKPKGRGYLLQPSPVKEYAVKQGIPVVQPDTLRAESFFDWLREKSPDMIVVAAFGKILPENVLSFPRYGCINVHGSLLPQYRGAAPMQRAIIDGCSKTGITIMQMDAGLDTGDMLQSASVTIEEDDNFETIHDKLGECGAGLLVDTIQKIEAGTAVRIPQEEAKATYAAKITKEECLLDFSASAKEIHDRIRGLSPFPLAFTHTPDGKLLKIVRSHVAYAKGDFGVPGEVIRLDESIVVSCGNGCVALDAVLPEGKGRMSAADYIRGRKIAIKDLLK